MKKLLVILFLIIFSVPSFGAENRDKDYETFLQNRLDVFLYYELYDAFCRRHGYGYVEHTYTETVPARVEIKTSDRATDSDYRYFFDRYKDYLSGAKSPDGTFISELRKLGEQNISAELIPEKKIKGTYTNFEINATDKQRINEVDKVWLAKKGKVKPKPYSMEAELKKYKVLTEKDVKLVVDNLEKRFENDKLYYNYKEGEVCVTDYNSGFYDKISDYFDSKYSECNGNYELFREYAKDIDEKLKNYYPQNLYYEDTKRAKTVPYFFKSPSHGSTDSDPDIEIILSAFEGTVTSIDVRIEGYMCYICSINNNGLHYNNLLEFMNKSTRVYLSALLQTDCIGSGNKVTRVGKTKVFRDENGQIIAIGDKKVTRDDNGKVIKIGEDLIKRNKYDVIMQVGDKKFFRNPDGTIFYIGNPEYTTNDRGELATLNGKTVTTEDNYVTEIGEKIVRYRY